MGNEMDLNLLLLFESLSRTSSVTKTAKEFGMSQSAVSHALARLREHFQDPLFVRVPKGVVPTDFARNLAADVNLVVKMAKNISKKPEPFERKTAKGTIHLFSTDLVEALLMPKLLPRLQKEVPEVTFSIRPTGGELPKELLETGQCDIAIAGFYKDLPAGFFQTKIADLDFSTAYRQGHPNAKKGLSPKEFWEADHALITLKGDFKDHLQKPREKGRKFRYGSYSFTGMAWSLAHSDLVLTAPTALLKQYQEYFPILIQKSPVDIPKIKLRMVWHEQTHKDPLRLWLRQVIKDEFSKI